MAKMGMVRNRPEKFPDPLRYVDMRAKRCPERDAEAKKSWICLLP